MSSSMHNCWLWVNPRYHWFLCNSNGDTLDRDGANLINKTMWRTKSTTSND